MTTDSQASQQAPGSEPQKIGIVGGGQLAGMLAEELKLQGAVCYSLDPDPQSPAVTMGAVGVTGDRKNNADIARLAAISDVVTVDLEDVSVEGLAEIAAAGHRVIPPVANLQRLTNKLEQKKILQQAGIPTSPFIECDASDNFDYGQLGWPVVQKAAQGGYDGRGVAILRNPEDAASHLQAPGYIEAFVADVTELAVMVAREPGGRTTVWNTVEMAFDPVNNLMTWLIAPARCSAEISAAAQDFARRTV
ncbi:MAG: ATP-grasp domain-containing protein, partial [Pseudomonadales bacterium]|nr:ATP-grasp domain-containing protein [Pseudomonadales bacterium]